MGVNSNEEPVRAGPASSGPSHGAIREQLERILASREFQATEKVRAFLRFVVEETLAGRSHRLKGYTIATQVYGRGKDFDAAQDPIVRIQAGRLRRALERYYLVAGTRDPISIDIPKGGYVPRFAARIGEPAGSRDAARTPGSEPPTMRMGPSVAVLPLENLTGDPDQTFFAVGLAEDLATELGRFQDLTVMTCMCTPTVTEPPVEPVEMAKLTGARFMLRGTVRRDAETVKVSMQLVDADGGRQVWAEGYTHQVAANQLIATQERIAQSVVAAVASEYGIIARRLSAESRKKPPAELDTYEAMLRYYSHQVVPSPESAAACFPALRRAVEREPDYGPAWSALATLHCQLYSMDIPGFEHALDIAIDHARRGVALEPASQLGRLILAYVSYIADDLESFEQEIETALALNPNSPYTVGTVGYFHAMRGDFERGLPQLDRAIALNPCHPAWFHAGYVIHDLCRHDFERALRELQQHRPFMTFWLDVAYAAVLAPLGRLDEARDHLTKVGAQKPDFAARARELLRRTVKIDPLLDDVVDSLRLVGLPQTERRAAV